MNKKIIVIFLLVILTVSVFSGCTNDDSQQTDENDNTEKTYNINTNYPRESLGLNKEGEAAFTNAIDKYSELKQTMSAEDARSALVDELNNDFENVKEATLSEDGYTIGLVFEDDTAALLITSFDFNDTSNNADNSNSFSIIKKHDKTMNEKTLTISSKEQYLKPVASEVGSSDECPNPDFIVPLNRKMYYYRADVYTNEFQSSFASIRTFDGFKKYGWTDNDFETVAYLDTSDWDSVTPDDLLDMSGYGIIIYSGKAAYYPHHPKAIPGSFYLQCTFKADMDDFDFWKDTVGEQRYLEYMAWRDQGRLIFTGMEDTGGNWYYGYSMDIDLIKEKGSIDPGAMVFVYSINGWKAKDAYMNMGAGCFLGWDGIASTIHGSDAFSELLFYMLNSETPQTASYAYNKLSSVNRKSVFGGTLQIETNGLDFYLPSFGKMKVNLDSPPSGTSTYKLDFYPYGTADKTTVSSGEEIEYDGVSPVNTIITITADSSTGGALDSGVVLPSLISGENTLMEIKSWTAYGIILEADPTLVESDGLDTSKITATVKTFKEDDVVKPTGTDLACKEVEFITNLGSFNSESKILTDINGEATINLKSDKDGIATVRAIIGDEGIESYKTQNITFGEVPYSFRLVEKRTTQADSSGDIIDVMAWGYYLVFKGKEGIDAYVIKRTCPDYEKEYSTDGKLPYADDYYKDLRILSDSERAEYQEEYDKDGMRFYLFRGKPVSISDTNDAWQTTLEEKQNYLLNSLSECTFTIEAYNS